MRSRFIDEMGAPKTDLRKKDQRCCAICGVKITSRNFAMSSIALEGDGNWSKVKVYCDKCFLKPEAMPVWEVK